MNGINVSEKFIDIIDNLVRKGFTEKDLLQAKKCLLDYIGVTLAGSKQSLEVCEGYITENAGEYSVIGMGRKADLNSAVLVNAYNAHVLELDDGHRIGMMHLAAPVFSGLLTVAEKKDCKLNDLLYGAIAGYEAAIRLASAMQPDHKVKGFHATGTCGTVGCAIAIGVMLGYTRTELYNTLSAAATSGAGLLEVITGESMQKPYNISNAAISGINAALFGKDFLGPKDILGGERGFIKNFSDVNNIEVLLADRPEPAIHTIYMKPYAACRHCHSPIEGALNISTREKIHPDEIDDIIVETYKLAVKGHDHCLIEGINSAKMSIPYSVSSALLFNKAGMDVYTKEVIYGEEIQKLVQKIVVKEKEEFSREFPQKRVSTVKVNWKNGKTEITKVEYPKGEPENPINDKELLEKFNSLVAVSGITFDMAQSIADCVMDNKDVSVRTLMDLV